METEDEASKQKAEPSGLDLANAALFAQTLDVAAIEAKKPTPQLPGKQSLGLNLSEGAGEPAEFPAPRKPGHFLARQE